MYRLNYCQPGALPPFRAFALTAREGLVALPRVSLPSVAGPGLQALPPAEVEGWPSAILNAAYGAYTMETICGTTHCDCLPDSNNYLSLLLSGKSIAGHRIAVLCVKSDCVKYQDNYGLQYCDFGYPAHLCTMFIRKKSNMSGTVSVQVVEKTKTRKQRAVKPFGQAYHNDTVTLEKLKDKKIPPSESGGRDFYCLLFV